jgi:predicted transcriptional regulator
MIMIAVPYTNLTDHFVSYMMSKYIHEYRNRINIIGELLHTARARATKTEMMYMRMFSFVQLKEYLQMLAENDLIVYDKTSQGFPTSDKGCQFRNRHKGLVMLIAPNIHSSTKIEEKVMTVPN